MLEAGISISPSTDNRTVSNTTVSEEIFKIQSAFKLDKDTILSLIKNGFKAKFA
jgi:adenosine deaminase